MEQILLKMHYLVVVYFCVWIRYVKVSRFNHFVFNKRDISIIFNYLVNVHNSFSQTKNIIVKYNQPILDNACLENIHWHPIIESNQRFCVVDICSGQFYWNDVLLARAGLTKQNYQLTIFCKSSTIREISNYKVPCLVQIFINSHNGMILC